MATRTTVGIGILEVGGVITLVVVATEIGKVIEGLAVGQRVPLEAKPKMVEAMGETVVTLVVAMATILTTATDRVILVVQQTRWVPLVTKASRAPLSSGACKGALRMA